MFNEHYETTLVSQLLDSIDNHLKTVDLSMAQKESHAYQSSVDNPDDADDDDDELWLSGHRSIFSSYGSHYQKNLSPFHNSQYEGFHWDLYENYNCHYLAFEHNQQNTCQEKNLSQWSMHFNSDSTTSLSDRPQTSWHEIKTKSMNHSYLSSRNTSNKDHNASNPLKLYHLFQRTKSQQHPCHLYENFSDKSICDSLTSSSSSSSSSLCSNSIKQEQSKNSVDQCLQTSISLSEKDNFIVTHSKNVNHLLNNPTHSSSTSHHSLPNLDFLTYYAKENPPSLLTVTNQFCTAMKSTLSEPLSLTKKATYTIFYFSINGPNQTKTLYPSLSTIQKHKETKRMQNLKICPSKMSTEETEAFSSTCSSISSSGYFSNSSTNQPHHIQTRSSPYPLKSCLKRAKTEQSTNASSTANVRAVGVSEDIISLPNRCVHNENDTLKTRHSSVSTTSSHKQNLLLKIRTRNKTCTLSEHDLQTKKNVSFCDEIVRRLITSSTSPKYPYEDYCDLIPQEYLIDSPPNEFNLSDDDKNEDQLINFIENVPTNLTKRFPLKNTTDKYLIDAFSNTILHILEIKCGDPKSYYLNNQINYELDRILRQDLCSLLREILDDGLRQYSGSLFSKKMNLWRVIELLTPITSRFNEAKMKAQLDIPSTIDWIEKFNSFIYHLLNLHELASWLTHFISNRKLLNTYYESSAFLLVNTNNDLFECITNQLEKLSPLQFRLKYKILSNSKILGNNQRLSSSILMKKFNVRAWLRDRKAQIKISSKESQISSTKSISSVLSNVSIRRKSNTLPGSGQR
ncbi:unnamed protein product [Rotaria sp. Silwood2]|nr:unnamed protein product [Rotaria sp. Silwood2]CAF2542527.1 unnamed protein product [Rotaria sp. Silwood2]CAF2922871.1 unnamed protein product [Rotaria sp. Silwood2]CAF4037800.1 unnamed protein product [Rotaria sp. Silwood2]CAF4060203.1 unnamed protein product [Rotaria sp. Silwood2]